MTQPRVKTSCCVWPPRSYADVKAENSRKKSRGGKAWPKR
jgi:hypothetical protein